MQPMLLREWDYRDPAGWLVQEKFDGIRATWDGATLWTREGHKVPCPDWFVADLPPTPLDGELWTGKRGDLNGMLSILGKRLSADWRGVRFTVFDAPGNAPVEARLAKLQSLDLPDHCEVAAATECKDECHLEDLLDEVATLGGEGLVLRLPGSGYEHKRSGNVRKLRLAS